jgi:hypothetical protein
MQTEAKIDRGEAYMYKEKSLTSEKIYKLPDTLVFLIDSYDENDDFVEISIPRNIYSKSVSNGNTYLHDNFYISGYVEKSGIRFIDSLKQVKGTSVGLVFYIRKADTTKTLSKTNMRYGLGIPLNMSWEVKEMYLIWKGKLIKQDRMLYDDLFNVTYRPGKYSSINNDKFRIYYDNGIYYIKQNCADGCGSYEITWVIKDGKIIQRLVDEI